MTVIPTRTPLLRAVAAAWVDRRQAKARRAVARAQAAQRLARPLVPDWQVPDDMCELLAILAAAAGMSALLGLITLLDGWDVIGTALAQLARG
jgi:hypothetical protein